MTALKELLKTRSGGLEVPGDSPLSEDIENAKIDRHLKIPSIEQFDGTIDLMDFINMFDARMSFFGNAEIARCLFYYTCLKSTALEWFNNLPPRSIELWQALKRNSGRGFLAMENEEDESARSRKFSDLKNKHIDFSSLQ